MRKIALAAILVTLFVLASVPLAAHADGSLCGTTITTSTTLASDVDCSGSATGFALAIGANGVVLNCAGHTVTAPPDKDAIDAYYVTKITIENCVVQPTGNLPDGIYLQGVTHSTVTRNTVNGANEGIYLWGGDNHDTVTSNTVKGGMWGVDIECSSYVTVKSNTVSGTYFNGLLAYQVANGIYSGNYAHNNGGNGVYAGDSPHLTMTGNTASYNNKSGFFFDYTASVTFSGNTASHNHDGFYCDQACTGDTFRQNTVSYNNHSGFYISYSTAESFTRNTVTNNLYAFYFYELASPTVSRNTVSYNGYGIYLYCYSDSGTFAGNTISGNVYGIYVDPSYTSNPNTMNNHFSSNLLKTNSYAVYDSTTGLGTMSTGNYYADFCTLNTNPSYPAGLC